MWRILIAFTALSASTIARADACATAAFNTVVTENVMTVCAGIQFTPDGLADQPNWSQTLGGCANAETELAIARSRVQQIVREEPSAHKACALLAEYANVESPYGDVFQGHK